MADIPDSQGATLSFNGVELGDIQTVATSAAVGVVHDMTSKRSSVIGTGDSARVRRQVTCTSVDPASIECKFWGTPPFTVEEVGSTGMFSFSGGGSSLSARAFLADLQSDHAVGEPAQWSATFKFLG